MSFLRVKLTSFTVASLPILLLALMFPLLWIPEIAHKPGNNEELSDFFHYFYVFDSVVNGFLPLWNPFHDGGGPFYTAALGQRFNIVEVSYAFLIKTAVDLGLRFGNHVSYYKICLWVNFIYLVISYLGTHRLLRIFWPHRMACAAFALLITFLMGNFYDYNGYYISSLAIYAFYPFCACYIFRFFLAQPTPLLSVKLALSCSLLITHAGICVVPTALVLLSLFLCHLIFRPAGFPARSFNMTTAVREVLPAALVAAVILAPGIFVYVNEIDNVVREGRVFQNTSFMELIHAVQGAHGLSRLNYVAFVPMNSPYYCGLILQFFFFLGMIRRWKHFLGFFVFTLFQFSVFLMEYSPFLNLYYRALPFLRQARYWGGIYDTFLFTYMIWAMIGFREFPSSRHLKPILGALCLTAAVGAGSVQNVAVSTWIPFGLFAMALVYFCFPGNAHGPDQSPKNWMAATALASVLIVADLGYKNIWKNTLYIVGAARDSLGFPEGLRESYMYPRMRTSRRLPIDSLGNYVLSDRILTYWLDPSPYHIHIARSARLRSLFSGQDTALAHLFGCTRDILSFQTHLRVVNSETEAWRMLRANPESSVVEIPDELAASIRSAATRAGNGGPASTDIRVLEFLPNSLTLELETLQPGFLVWLDGFHGFWKAELDAGPTPVFPTDGNFKSIFIDRPGRHRISFRFEPGLFEVLLTLSYATIGMTTLLLLGQALRREQATWPGPHF